VISGSSKWQTPNKRVQFGYRLNYMIDAGHSIIVDVEVTPARTYDDVAVTQTMLERTDQILGLKPDWLAAGHLGPGRTARNPPTALSRRESVRSES
jgi:hypothetical protein